MFTCLLDIEHAWSWVQGLNPGLNIINSCLVPDDEYSTILKAFTHDEAPEFELSAALES